MHAGDAKFATLLEYQLAGCDGSEGMPKRAFAVLLLQNPTSGRAKPAARKDSRRPFAADFLQKQQNSGRNREKTRLAPPGRQTKAAANAG
ncbi:MAG: hypothetical protein AB7H71_08795 [Alphaproteobacteria bacterium]